MIFKRKKNKSRRNHVRGCDCDYYSILSTGHMVFTLKNGYWIRYSFNGSLVLHKDTVPTKSPLNIKSDITKVFIKLIDDHHPSYCSLPRF